jgi:hypothetical protein
MSTLKAINVQHPSSSTTNIVNDSSGNVTVGNNLTVTGTSTIGGNETVTGTVAMGSSFKRNRIINGNALVWQRGTSGFTSGYCTDRWFLNGANAASQSTDVPSGFKYSLSFTNSASTSCGVSQRIESVNTTDLASQNVTVSFWFKRSGAAGNLQVNLDYPTATDNYTSTGSIGATQVSASPATSWTYYTVTFTSISANVVNGLQVSIFSNNGTSASLGGLVTGVQLEVGTKATPYEMQIYSDQLAQCQRYCYVTNGLSIGRAYSTTAFSFAPILPVPMRTTPSASATAALSVIVPGTATYTQSSANVAIDGSYGIYGFLVNLGNFTGVTAGAIGYMYTSNFVTLSAEL